MEAGQLDEAARTRLIDLLALVRRLLDRLLRPDHDGWLLSHENYQLLSRAHEELIRERRFEDVEELINSPNLGPALTEQGLTGSKLAFEVAIAESTAAEAERIDDRRLAGRKKVGRLLGLALKAATVALGSLGKIVPPAGIIQEVKDGAEVAVEAGAPYRQRIFAKVRRVVRWPGKRSEPPVEAPVGPDESR